MKRKTIIYLILSLIIIASVSASGILTSRTVDIELNEKQNKYITDEALASNITIDEQVANMSLSAIENSRMREITRGFELATKRCKDNEDCMTATTITINKDYPEVKAEWEK